MKLVAGRPRFSPRDLIAYLDSDFASWCERLDVERRAGHIAETAGIALIVKDETDEQLALAARFGIDHEKAYLETLRASHPGLVEITEDSADRVADTLAAMRAGAPVIYQAVLQAGDWYGIADFLQRVELPIGEHSAFGNYCYEPFDTKLARKAKPYFLIQLCAYADLLESAQGVRPKTIGIAYGAGATNAVECFKTRDFWAYYRELKSSFERFQRNWRVDAIPDPGADREHGRWHAAAQQILNQRDDLWFIANSSRSQIKRLRDAGFSTLTALATARPQAVNRIAVDTLATLVNQAAMQHATRTMGTIQWQPRATSSEPPPRGLATLPPPSVNDVFFDFEGFPFATGGLEYLFGAVTIDTGTPVFHDWWAHDAVQERRAFEQFIDWAYRRWHRDRSMHIYHYAAYEKAALTRLMSKYATREAELDDLLRGDVLVDLYTVVRQGMVIGTPSYSLKDIEHLYMPARTQQVTSAGGSVVEYQHWIDSGESQDYRQSPRLAAIRDYNRVDCESTVALRDWLLDRQRETGVQWVLPADARTPEAPVKEMSEAQRLAQSMLSLAESPPDSDEKSITRLLAWLVEFHRRDEKPFWWHYFERRKMTDDELCADHDCLGGLVRTARAPWVVDRSTGWEYAFDADQDTRLHEGDQCEAANMPGFKCTIIALDRDKGLVEVKVSKGKTPPNTLSLMPCKVIGTEALRDAIFHYVALWFAGKSPSRAVDDLVARHPPRITGHAGGPVIDPGGDLLQQSIDVVRRLDHTTLAIQGPPGTGKTHTAAAMILALLQDGKRVGVAANSHSVVLNLLSAVAKAAAEAQIAVRLYESNSSKEHPAFASGEIKCIASSDAASLIDQGPLVVGGTAWLFARPELRNTLDYLFIDEAGQVSLANAVAVGQAARNLVLIGDQMQLAQPTQGTHPGASGLSCLEHLLARHHTIPADLGIFLGISYRMHPDVCRVVSESYYEGRLHSVDDTANNRVTVPVPTRVTQSTGVLWVPVPHEDNTQESCEECDVIVQLVRELLTGRVTIQHDAERAMTPDDILVVAPFNAQVRQLKTALGGGVEVGTVDKFQGKEAPVVIVSMCTSTLDIAPRGAEFLLSPNRLNVAISRAQALAIVVGSPGLGNVKVRSMEEMRLVSGWCGIAVGAPLAAPAV